MKKSKSIWLVLAVICVACQPKNNPQNSQIMQNPLVQESTLPYSAPDFSKITDAHYKEALLWAMKQQSTAVEQITQNTEQPNFENTILALEKSGYDLDRISNIFFAVTSAHTNDGIQQIQQELSPVMAMHSDSIFLNDKLFQKVKAVYQQRNQLNLDAESQRLVTYYYDNFLISGANLSGEDKENLKKINAKLASLTNDFNQKLLSANKENALVVSDENQLQGLSDAEKKVYQQGDGSWRIPLLNTTQQPLLSALEQAQTRTDLFAKSWNRAQSGSSSTLEIVKEIAQLRSQKAQLLGFENYAAWSLQQSMAKTPQNVFSFLEKLIPHAVEKAKNEAQDIQKLMQKENPGAHLQPQDWDFYAEKVRKQKYDLDESQLKPYFVLDSVLEKGVFFSATKLYGITFKKRTDLPVYHPDVVVYELFEENGEPLGLFYGDFFARESKRGGAWMSNFVTQSKLWSKKPVIYNVCNYTKPAEGEPALLSYDEVTTLFHEFGHALHGFFANQHYPSLSGTAVARDFVELPSQFNENWALYPEVLKNYAHHYQTQEVISQQLIDKIKKAATFNQGYAFTEVLEASYLDMKWHTLPQGTEISQVNDFEKQAIERFPSHLVPPRYRSAYFAHIFGGGYAAGYYSYQYSEMLEHDAFSWFEQNGGMTRANGQRFRDMILSKGNTMDYEKMYEAFRGGAPSIQPLLKARGLE